MNQMFSEHKNWIDMQKPFPKAKYLKFKIEVRAGRLFYIVSDRYNDIYLGLCSNRTGRWYFVATENRFDPEQLQEIARVCKWLDNNNNNEPDTQNTIPENPS